MTISRTLLTRRYWTDTGIDFKIMYELRYLSRNITVITFYYETYYEIKNRDYIQVRKIKTKLIDMMTGIRRKSLQLQRQED